MFFDVFFRQKTRKKKKKKAETFAKKRGKKGCVDIFSSFFGAKKARKTAFSVVFRAFFRRNFGFWGSKCEKSMPEYLFSYISYMNMRRDRVFSSIFPPKMRFAGHIWPFFFQNPARAVRFAIKMRTRAFLRIFYM
jgi:hypothetical protein